MAANVLEERDPRFVHLEAKVGFVVFIALAAIFLTIAVVGMEKDLFTKKYYIKFYTDSGTGLFEGMPVKLSGFKIGKIKDIDLSDDSRIVVTLEINSKYKKWLRKGTVAKRVKEGFIGEPIVDVSTGDPEGRILEDGDTIPYEKVGGIEELIKKTKPVLAEVKNIIEYANDPEGDLRVTFRNMRTLTTELIEVSRSLKGTLREVKKSAKDVAVLLNKARGFAVKLDEKGPPAVDRAARVLENLEDITKDLKPVAENIKTVAGNAEEASEKFAPIAEKIDGVLSDVRDLTGTFSSETPRIKELIEDTHRTVREGSEVVRGVRQSWPVRLMVPPPKRPSLVPLDSYLYER